MSCASGNRGGLFSHSFCRPVGDHLTLHQDPYTALQWIEALREVARYSRNVRISLSIAPGCSSTEACAAPGMNATRASTI